MKAHVGEHMTANGIRSGTDQVVLLEPADVDWLVDKIVEKLRSQPLQVITVDSGVTR
jgi:hypothetical protein